MTSLERYAADPDLAGFRIVPHPSYRILLRSEFEPFAAAFGLRGAPVQRVALTDGGRVRHPIVTLPTGDRVVIRGYLRGGAVRHLVRETYLAGNRALEEARLTERARTHGVRAPLVVGAVERPARIGYTATLLTRWIPDTVELLRWLPSSTAAGRAEALLAAGREIGRMHAAGVAHPDLNLRNVLVGAHGAGEPIVHLLDFDRARGYEGPVPPHRRRADLRRLARSAAKLGAGIPAEGWEALRAGYGADWPLAGPLP